MKWIFRIIGGVAALVVLVMLGLFVAGKRGGAGVNEATVTIERPAPQVFRYLTDETLTMKWVSGLVEITSVGGGEMKPGAKSKLLVELDGQRTEMREEILELEQNRKLVMRLENGDASAGFTETATYTVSEEGGRTRLTLKGVTDYHGFMLDLLEPLITSSAQTKLEGDLQRLKRLVEAEPPMRTAATP
jgi:uncharacterized protein YndB with AHSA1/START domain